LIEHAVVVPLLLPAAPAASRDQLSAALAGESIIALADGAASGSLPTDRPIVKEGRLTGTVPLVHYGALADQYVVVADGEGSEPAIVLIPASTEGVTVLAQDSFDPITRYARVSFDQVAVEYPLVAPLEVGTTIERLRDYSRLMIAVEVTGITRRLLDQSVSYALERHQFGKPIGSFQALQHLLADLAASVLMLEAATEDALRRANDAPEDVRIASLQLKALTAWLGRKVGEGALQVHGGIGFTIEHDVHRGVQHVLALQGTYGDEHDLARDLGHALLRGEHEPWT
jgi:alkylation response protein AidB-like acyl-CoA dehydrogenase